MVEKKSRRRGQQYCFKSFTTTQRKFNGLRFGVTLFFSLFCTRSPRPRSPIYIYTYIHIYINKTHGLSSKVVSRTRAQIFVGSFAQRDLRLEACYASYETSHPMPLCSRPSRRAGSTTMGWQRLVGSLKLQVSFAKGPYKRDCFRQKRLIILRSLLIVATPMSALYSTNWGTDIGN